MKDRFVTLYTLVNILPEIEGGELRTHCVELTVPVRRVMELNHHTGRVTLLDESSQQLRYYTVVPDSIPALCDYLTRG